LSVLRGRCPNLDTTAPRLNFDNKLSFLRHMELNRWRVRRLCV
jgi:hypothetical protein